MTSFEATVWSQFHWVVSVWVFVTVWLLTRAAFALKQQVGYQTLRTLVGKHLSWSTREKVTTRLKRAGMANWQAVDWVILRVALSCFAGLFTLLLLGQGWAGVLAFLMMRLGLWMILVSKIKSQRLQVTHDLPYFLDLLCMSLTSGMNLQSGVNTTLAYLPPGVLKMAWEQYVFDIRSGVTYEVALEKLVTDTGHDDLRRVCVTLIQAQQRGMSVAHLLSEHAAQIRASYLLRAEKKALQAPVRMLFPLITCFFPCTFMILGFAIWISVAT